MHWIDEMFVNMEKDRAAASATRSAKVAKADRTAHLKKQTPGTLKAWDALVSAITNDVNEFNNHKERAGQTPARISLRRLECEVHLPGMQGKRLVLTLDDKDIHVSVHPEFPKQPLPIAMELDGAGQNVSWLVGESTEVNAKRSSEQLSEYLLKPVLSCAAIT